MSTGRSIHAVPSITPSPTEGIISHLTVSDYTTLRMSARTIRKVLTFAAARGLDLLTGRETSHSTAMGVVLHECQADGRWCLVTYGEDIGMGGAPASGTDDGQRDRSSGVDDIAAPLPPPTGGSEAVALVSDGGTFKVPVTINGQLTLKFVVDSGASDVSIPADVVATLVRTETITDADFLDKQTYQIG